MKYTAWVIRKTEDGKLSLDSSNIRIYEQKAVLKTVAGANRIMARR
jgi:hypothetical protein